MTPELRQRPEWQIDRLLDSLIGKPVRVAADTFSPEPWNGQEPKWWVATRQLILPDNSRPAGLPVYFEGRLQQFTRQIGVVYVVLDAPGLPEPSAEGIIFYRGSSVVVLRGPATVKLAYPFQVEKLPEDAANYWKDLQVPRVQFEFPF